MSYEFECRHVVPGCEGKVEGESVDEVLQAATRHADEAHGLAELDEATLGKVKASIVESG